ncbi:MAG: transposase [Pseudomonadales bacterium]|nr:transposase [Pseudomonadales bacterium]MCP5215824.1 transposase [Pseudomonadales bacterium]
MQPVPLSKDGDARWVKKAGRFYLGYKLHASSDEEGYIETVHVTAANAHESRHLAPLLDEATPGTQVLADKGYASAAKRDELADRGLGDGIMHKAVRGKPLTTAQQQANRAIKAKRWVIEQSFGTLKRRFRFCKANYFGREKVLGQSYLKAMCLNLLKASNKVCYG